MLMTVKMPGADEEVKKAQIIQCTNVFIEVTPTQRRDHQVITYLMKKHNIFNA